MAKQDYWGQKAYTGVPWGFGVRVEYGERTITETFQRSYEEVMRTAEFDSCGRVIHTIPGYYTKDKIVKEWKVIEIGWWDDDELEEPWCPGGKPWRELTLRHTIENCHGVQTYEVQLKDALEHQQMKVKDYSLYYSIIGAGKDYIEIETGSTKNDRVHNVFRLPNGGVGKWEAMDGSYHVVHTITLL